MVMRRTRVLAQLIQRDWAAEEILDDPVCLKISAEISAMALVDILGVLDGLPVVPNEILRGKILDVIERAYVPDNPWEGR
jgi:hypothetical protein